MERIAHGGMAGALRLRIGLGIEQAVWEIRRAMRAFTRCAGAWGWGLLMISFIGALAWLAERWQTHVAGALEMQVAEHLIKQTRRTVPGLQSMSEDLDGRARLKEFDAYLLPHEDIPMSLQDLLSVAEEEDLVIQRGEYRPQVDTAGGFLRYRMTLPVEGEAAAVQRFMQAALRTQKTLALEGAQFKRERVDSTLIEARIQWVMMTRLPEREERLLSTGALVAGSVQ